MEVQTDGEMLGLVISWMNLNAYKMYKWNFPVGNNSQRFQRLQGSFRDTISSHPHRHNKENYNRERDKLRTEMTKFWTSTKKNEQRKNKREVSAK